MKWKLAILYIVFLSFTLLTLVNADLGTYKQNNCVDVKGQINATSSNVTIYYPNSTVAINNQEMTNLRGEIFNYTFCNTSELGIYIYDYCDENGGNCIENDFTITSSGFSVTEANSTIFMVAIFFFLIVSVLFFIGFLRKDIKPQSKWTFFLFSFIFFLTSINLISIVINDSLLNNDIAGFFDFIVAASFYLYWLLFGLLAVIWFITILNTYLFQQKIKNKDIYGEW